jgi:hypothetical protein
VSLGVVCGNVARAADEHFDSLTMAGNTYSNVTVITKTAKHVSFKHSKGFASVKVTDISEDLRLKLGYAPPPPPKKPLDFTKDLTKDLTKGYQLDPRVQEIQDHIRKKVEAMIEQRDPALTYGVLGGFAFAYLFFCFTTMLICQKTGNKPGALAWIPPFQIIALLKAAGMSGWWFISLLLPPIPLFVYIVWCFKICKTRAKSPALGLLLLLPLLQILTWLYLAFSDGGRDDDSSEPGKKKSKNNSGKLRLSYQHQN